MIYLYDVTRIDDLKEKFSNYEIIDFTKGDIEDVWIVKDIIISRR